MAEITAAETKKMKRGGPSIGELIVKAVAASKDRRGVSFDFIKKALAARGYDVAKKACRVRTTVKALVVKGTLVRISGCGALGSFKINDKTKKPTAAKKPPPKKVKNRTAAEKATTKAPAETNQPSDE